jgi:AcrR family transcriptional regulator
MSEFLSELSRDRLLQAAIEIFAEKGFQSATVREICSRAEANVAAVNYYFRNKEKLYAEALAFAFHQAEQRYPMIEAGDRELSPELRLTHFIRVFLDRILDDSSLGHHSKLFAREIADPTRALDEIVQVIIAPMFALVADIVTQLTNSKLDQHTVRRCILSILGQCLMFKHSRAVIDRLCPELIANPEETARCAAHIAQFSLLAIREIASQPLEVGA